MQLTIIRAIVIIGVLVLGVLLQTVWPVTDNRRMLDSASDKAYAYLTPNRPVREGGSKVAIIEIDQETYFRLGWPIDRSLYVDMLDKLRQRGNPWLLSLLNFQDLGNDDANERLAAAVKRYGKVIGSPLSTDMDEELSDFQEEVLLPRAMLVRDKSAYDDLLSFPFGFREDDRITAQYAGFGFGARFALSPVVICKQMYVDSVSDPGYQTVPSSTLVTIDKFLKYGVRLPNGHTLSEPAKQIVYPGQCFSHLDVGTTEYLKRRRVQIVPMHGFLKSPESYNFDDRLVVLSVFDIRKHLGPGKAVNGAIAAEHYLLARLIDEIIEGTSVGRLRLEQHPTFAWHPIALAVIVGLLLLYFNHAVALVGLGVGFSILCGWSMVSIGVEKQFIVPIQGMMFCLVAGGWIGLFASLINGSLVRRYLRTREVLRIGLGQCQKISEVERVVAASCRQEFPTAQVEFREVSGLAELSELSTEGLLDKLKALVAKYKGIMQGNLSQWTPAVVKTVTVNSSSVATLERRVTGALVVHGRKETSGQITVRMQLRAWERLAGRLLLLAIQREIVMHWHRIELLVAGKISQLHEAKMLSDLELGRLVQATFLPDKLEDRIVEDWRYKFVFEPHGPMSGDWLQTHKAGRTGICAIGDVVGKGPGAALSTAVVASCWRNLALEWERDGFDLTRMSFVLNDTIHRLFDHQQNTTLAIAAVTGGSVLLSTFGTMPWQLLTADGEMKKFNRVRNNPLGHFDKIDNISYAEYDAQPGDLLFAYTDGVMDSLQQIHGFTESLRKDAANKGRGSIDLIIEHARRASHTTTFADDFTILVLERLPTSN